MAIRYYTENLAKIPFRLSYALFKHSMPAPLALVIATWLWVYDRLGFRVAPQHGVAFYGSEYPIDPSELPGKAVAKWAPLLEQFRDLGFIPLRTQRTPTIGAKLHYSTSLLHEGSSTVAVLEWIRLPGAGGFEESTTVELSTYPETGPDIVTGIAPAATALLSDMYDLESAEVVCLEDTRPLSESYQAHLERRNGRRCVAMTEDDALAEMEVRDKRRFTELIAKEYLRELTAEEIARLEQADVGDLHNC